MQINMALGELRAIFSENLGDTQCATIQNGDLISKELNQALSRISDLEGTVSSVKYVQTIASLSPGAPEDIDKKIKDQIRLCKEELVYFLNNRYTPPDSEVYRHFKEFFNIERVYDELITTLKIHEARYISISKRLEIYEFKHTEIDKAFERIDNSINILHSAHNLLLARVSHFEAEKTAIPQEEGTNISSRVTATFTQTADGSFVQVVN